MCILAQYIKPFFAVVHIIFLGNFQHTFLVCLFYQPEHKFVTI